MKKTTMICFLAALILAPVFAMSQGLPYVKLKGTDEKMLTLYAGPFDSEQVTLRLKDALGSTLYEEDFAIEGNLHKRYDLRNIKAGDYYFEIEDENKITVNPFEIVRNKLIVAQDLNMVMAKPAITFKGNGIYEVHLDNKEARPVYVYITNAEGTVILKEKLGSEKEIKKYYDFSKLEGMSYSVQVRQGQRTFDHTLPMQP